MQPSRQRQIIQTLAMEADHPNGQAEALAQVVFQAVSGAGLLGGRADRSGAGLPIAAGVPRKRRAPPPIEGQIKAVLPAPIGGERLAGSTIHELGQPESRQSPPALYAALPSSGDPRRETASGRCGFAGFAPERTVPIINLTVTWKRPGVLFQPIPESAPNDSSYWWTATGTSGGIDSEVVAGLDRNRWRF